MVPSSESDRLPHWHSLLYSTGMMLIVCGIPAGFLSGYLIAKDEEMEAPALLGLWMSIGTGIAGVSSLTLGKIATWKARRKKEVAQPQAKPTD